MNAFGADQLEGDDILGIEKEAAGWSSRLRGYSTVTDFARFRG